MRRKLLLLLLLIIVLPVAAYIGFPWYIKPLANQAVGGTGAQITLARVDRPGLDSVFIRELRVDQAGGASVSLINTRIRFFDFFSRFNVAAERVDIVAGEKQDGAPPDSRLLSEYLPENYLSLIPLLDISIDTVNIRRSDNSHAVGNDQMLIQLRQVDIAKSQDQLRMEGNLVGKENLILALSINRGNAFRFAVGKRVNRPPLLLMESIVTHNRHNITLQSNLTVDITEPVELKTDLDNVVTGFTGRMQSNLDLVLEDMPLADFVRHPVIRAKGTVTSDMENAAREIKLAAATTVEVNLDKSDWSIQLMPARALHPARPLHPAQPLKVFSLQFNRDGRQHIVTALLPEPVTLSGQTGSLSKQNLATNESVIMFGYVVDGNAVAEAGISRLAWNGLPFGNEQFRASMHIKAKADGEKVFALTQVDGLQLNGSKLDFSAALELHRDYVNVDIQENASLSATRISTEQFAVNEARINFPPQQISVSREEIAAGKIAFNLQADNLATDTHTLSPVNASGHLTLAKSHAVLTLATNDSRLRKIPKGKAHRLPPYRAEAELRWSEASAEQAERQLKNVDFRLFNQCDKEVLVGTWRAGVGLHIDAQHDFSKQHSLKRWLNLKDLTADITRGKLQAVIDWPTGPKNTHTDTLPTLSVKLENANIEGSLGIMKNVQLALSTLPSKSGGRYKLMASADSVNTGAEVTNVVLETEVTAGEKGFGARILQAHGEVFGGRVSMVDQYWTAGKESTLAIQLFSMNLAQLVQTQNIDSVTTNGELTGVLPVRLNKDGSFALARGSLSDADGGIIRYQSSLSGGDLNQQLLLTLDVLRNFEYEKLDTQVEYNDGNLVLKSNILGSNPEVAGGQKIDLNLNTEVNLKSAFQAMRLQAGLAAQVENLFSSSEDSAAPLCQQPL